MSCKVKVIDFDGTETIYEVEPSKYGPGHGVNAIAYYVTIKDGVTIYIHPETVKRIEGLGILVIPPIGWAKGEQTTFWRIRVGIIEMAAIGTVFQFAK